MPPAPDLLHRISLGGEDGRRTSLNLWLAALKNGDTAEIDRLADVLDSEWDKQDAAGQTNWSEHDRNTVVLITGDTFSATRRRAHREATPSQETMTLIVTGGDRGRVAFLSVFLKAVFADDVERARQLYNVILEKIWNEQDRAGSEYWPEEQRILLRFMIQEIILALTLDEE
jgi:hypothetical protein